MKRLVAKVRAKSARSNPHIVLCYMVWFRSGAQSRTPRAFLPSRLRGGARRGWWWRWVDTKLAHRSIMHYTRSRIARSIHASLFFFFLSRWQPCRSHRRRSEPHSFLRPSPPPPPPPVPPMAPMLPKAWKRAMPLDLLLCRAELPLQERPCLSPLSQPSLFWSASLAVPLGMGQHLPRLPTVQQTRLGAGFMFWQTLPCHDPRPVFVPRPNPPCQPSPAGPSDMDRQAYGHVKHLKKKEGKK